MRIYTNVLSSNMKLNFENVTIKSYQFIEKSKFEKNKKKQKNVNPK